ncbi:hypothetical protein JYU34_011158 [Plutella xylostella]|uniref:Uncharacterized protein n=1 Tax=Plutella xylostella TaxID=51655 RepID=A0ABQ7QGN5_PLUXY|nr:hypothetical protein JYU34_011158 [Plutella xylostella]
MPYPKEIGYKVKFPNTLMGLFKRGWWEIPEIMGTSCLALVGIGLAIGGMWRYKRENGANPEYKMTYTVVRPDDPRAQLYKNPVHTKYP